MEMAISRVRCRKLWLRDVDKIAAHSFDLPEVALCIAVGEKMLVSRMRRSQPICVLNRAPVLLGSSRDFGDIGANAVRVGAIPQFSRSKRFR